MDSRKQSTAMTMTTANRWTLTPCCKALLGAILLGSIGSAAEGAFRPTLPLEQTLTPEGRQVYLPEVRPKAVVLSPDGRCLLTSGASDALIVLDPVTEKVRQKVPLPIGPDDAESAGWSPNPRLIPQPDAQISVCGLVFSPDGSRVYLSDVNGRIKVFTIDRSGIVKGLTSFRLPAANAPRRREEIPAGLAVSDDGKKLYVALNLSNGLLELDSATGAALRRFEVGVEPYDVVLCGATAYVSNWAGRRPRAENLTGPAGVGTMVRVDPHRFIASEGSLSVVDLRTGRVRSELPTGRHACGLARSPDGRWVAVANAAEDTVSIIDTRRDQVAETISLRWHEGDLLGATPNALTFDRTGRRLLVCNGTQNAVAIIAFAPGHSRLIGLIPVGWFPAAIACDDVRGKIYVANLKGEGTQSPEETPEKLKVHRFIGSLSILDPPQPGRLAALTTRVLLGYRRAAMAAAALPARASASPRPVPERAGEPSVFRHVIYVIKENRTYDQVLGDIPAGNGRPDLCIFGEQVTPNQHKLAEEFVLLDNTACAGICSADGHQWATSAFATDYVEKSFTNSPRSYPFGGLPDAVDAVAYAPTGFIWDDAAEHGVSLRNYGEFVLSTVRWKDQTRRGVPSYAEIAHDYGEKQGRIAYRCIPGIASLSGRSKTDTIGWDLHVSDQFRTDRFLEDFHEYEKMGNLPSLLILYLPQDHTSGTKAGVPTPAACVADNDLAMGRVVEALSRSAFWKDTCLFAIEDDSQDGWDHVSGYRTTAYVASAYTRRHAVASEPYSQPGLLRTIELILGLPPMKPNGRRRNALDRLLCQFSRLYAFYRGSQPGAA